MTETKQQIEADYIYCAIGWIRSAPLVAASYLAVIGKHDYEKMTGPERERLRIKCLKQLRETVGL